MSSLINFDELVNEVAKQHKVILTKDDPIFVTVTINQQLLAGFLKQIEFVINEFEKKSASKLVQEISEVKQAAEKLILGASKLFSDEVNKSATHIKNSISASQSNSSDQARQTSLEKKLIWLLTITCLSSILSLGSLILGLN